MKLYDGKKLVEITMHLWRNGEGLSPDWASDFFEAGSLVYDEERSVYLVDDVDYCLNQADDWKHREGDFAGDGGIEPDEIERIVLVDIIVA